MTKKDWTLEMAKGVMKGSELFKTWASGMLGKALEVNFYAVGETLVSIHKTQLLILDRLDKLERDRWADENEPPMLDDQTKPTPGLTE